MTVNCELFADCPATVTVKGPEVAPEGTTATAKPSFQPTTVAFAPLIETVLSPCVFPKPEPKIWTNVPIAPDVGEILVTVGVWANADHN